MVTLEGARKRSFDWSTCFASRRLRLYHWNHMVPQHRAISSSCAPQVVAPKPNQTTTKTRGMGREKKSNQTELGITCNTKC